MNKEDFLLELRKRLGHISKKEKEKCIKYYDEIISDRVEDNMTEEQAVEALGDIDKIVENITKDLPLSSLVICKIGNTINKQKDLTTLLLIILGFPLWFPLLVSFLSVILAIYISIIAVVIAFYAIAVGFSLGGIFSLIVGLLFLFKEPFYYTLCTLGISFTLIGLGFILFKPFTYLAKLILSSLKFLIRKIKLIFIRKKEF